MLLPNLLCGVLCAGTHDLHDLLTDLCGVATPLPSPAYPAGSAAHWGMWRAACWLLDNHWTRFVCLCVSGGEGDGRGREASGRGEEVDGG